MNNMEEKAYYRNYTPFNNEPNNGFVYPQITNYLQNVSGSLFLFLNMLCSISFKLIPFKDMNK